METLTPETYPYKPYPPFRDPDDWRESKTWGDARDEGKARLLVDDATADHDGKHARHDHPWCRRCTMRFRDAEAGARTPTPAEAQAALREATKQRVTQEHINAARLDLEHLTSSLEKLAERDGLSEDTVLALTRYAGDLDAWEFDQAEANTSTLRRCARYLTLHNGRPPADDFDPEADASTLADELLNADELDDLPTPEPLIEGVLNRHSYAILRGRDHTFKSFVALDWALCLATGKAWQGRTVPHRIRVLYIAGEGAYGLAARKRAWESAWQRQIDPAGFTLLPRAVDLFSGRELDELLRVIEEGFYTLVIVDTLRRASGKAEGNGSDMGTVVDNLDKIKRATVNGSVLTIAHTDKGDNDSRGFSGIEDDADIVWHAKREDGSPRLELTNTKMKDGPDGLTLNLLASDSHGSLIIEAATEQASRMETTANQEAVLHAMRTKFADLGASANTLMEVTGLSKSSFYDARRELLRAGLLVSAGTKARPTLELPQSEGPSDYPSEGVREGDTPADLHQSDSPNQSETGPRVSPSSPGGLRAPDSDSDVRDEESA